MFRRKMYEILFCIILFFFFKFSESIDVGDITCDPSPGHPINQPMGKPKGCKPGRVAWNYNRDACSWDGVSDYWWHEQYINQTLVDDMLSGVILSLAGVEENLPKAWDLIFKYYNENHNFGSVGYKKGEKISLKMNFNIFSGGYANQTQGNSVSSQYVKSTVRQLVYEAGVPQEDIFLFDASRWVPVNFWEGDVGLGKEFPDINFVDTEGGKSYTTKVEVDDDVMFYFSNPEVASWNTTKLPTVLTQSKYLINIDAFRGHHIAGITMTGKNFFGSIYRPDVDCNFAHGLPGHWCAESLHQWINCTGVILQQAGGWRDQRPMGVYNPLVDLLGHDHTAYGKGLLFLSDALYGGINELQAPPIRFDMPPFLGDWTCSSFGSLDPIALDSVAFDFLREEPQQPWPRVGCVDNYLHEGAMANDPVSKTVYSPSGHSIDSLGVHEHWNNMLDKEYSRNLGSGDGIELIKVHEL